MFCNKLFKVSFQPIALLFLMLGMFGCQQKIQGVNEKVNITENVVDKVQSNLSPNIIFILVDDLGFNDVGYLGSEIKTPNIDQLASKGTIIQHNYAYPICSPTRAALMTGQNPLTLGVDGPMENDAQVASDLKLLPEYLQEAGYQTWMVGKWHLGMGKKSAMPHKRGFDDFYGHLGGFIDFYTHVYFGGLDWQHNGTTLREEGHATDLITTQAIRKIGGYKGDKPFFMYLSYNAPHTPLQTVPEPIFDYSHIKSADRRVFAGMTSHLDQGIGKVIAALKSKGIDKNTMIVFMSDNGGNETAGADNGILRGEKGSVYEGGVRVPAVVYWPQNKISKQSFTGPIFAQDWLPTLLEAANIKSDNTYFDGRSVLTSVIPPYKEVTARNVLLGAKGAYAVYNWPWKLIAEKDAEYKLFNVELDPSENDNLYAQYPQKVADMSKIITSMPKRESKGAKGPPPESLFRNENGDFDHEIRKQETREPWADAAH
jgi:arylsulfatase A-like enzyme